jgi:hypothetical protein
VVHRALVEVVIDPEDRRLVECRGDGEVVRRPAGRAELLAERLERRRVLIIVVDVAQQTRQLTERGRVEPAVLLETVLGPARNCSRFQPAFGTPITGTSRRPRFAIARSAGKIFLYARAPVAPKNTRASELTLLTARPRDYDDFSTWPPNS